MIVSEDERLAPGHALADSRPMPVRALRSTVLIGLAVALLTTGCVKLGEVNALTLWRGIDLDCNYPGPKRQLH